MDKISLAMNIAEKLPVLVVSPEMSADQMTNRLVGAVGRIDPSNLTTGQLTEDKWGMLSEAINTLHQAPIEIHDAGVHTMSAIRSVAKHAKNQHKKLGLIVVDYLQLIDSSEDDADENRAAEAGNICRGLRLLAKELECPVLALSQLNRKLESRTDKHPIMSDLRDSGSIELGTDIVAFVYRDDYCTKEAFKTPSVAKIILTKQSNSCTASRTIFNLAWQAV